MPGSLAADRMACSDNAAPFPRGRQAITERNQAVDAARELTAERNMAITERQTAIAARDQAITERDQARHAAHQLTIELHELRRMTVAREPPPATDPPSRSAPGVDFGAAAVCPRVKGSEPRAAPRRWTSALVRWRGP